MSKSIEAKIAATPAASPIAIPLAIPPAVDVPGAAVAGPGEAEEGGSLGKERGTDFGIEGGGRNGEGGYESGLRPGPAEAS